MLQYFTTLIHNSRYRIATCSAYDSLWYLQSDHFTIRLIIYCTIINNKYYYSILCTHMHFLYSIREIPSNCQTQIFPRQDVTFCCPGVRLKLITWLLTNTSNPITGKTLLWIYTFATGLPIHLLALVVLVAVVEFWNQFTTLKKASTMTTLRATKRRC